MTQTHAREAYSIAVIGGDGIGPEVVAEGLKVLDAVTGESGPTFATTDYDLGARRWHATGETLPETVLEELRGHDAILLGAVAASRTLRPSATTSGPIPSPPMTARLRVSVTGSSCGVAGRASKPRRVLQGGAGTSQMPDSPPWSGRAVGRCERSGRSQRVSRRSDPGRAGPSTPAAPGGPSLPLRS